MILDALQQQGYQIVPVSDLLFKSDYYIERNSGIQKQKRVPAPQVKPSLQPVAPELIPE